MSIIIILICQKLELVGPIQPTIKLTVPFVIDSSGFQLRIEN